MIFSHGGGTLPFLIERFRLAAAIRRREDLPNGIEAEFKRYYYDTAFVTNSVAMSAMTALLPPSHILFGTDFPYRDGAGRQRTRRLRTDRGPAKRDHARERALVLTRLARLNSRSDP